MRAQVSFEGGVTREGPLTVAANVAVHSGVDLHVLLQGLLGLKALRTQQTEHRHVGPWRERARRHRQHGYFSTSTQADRAVSERENWVTFSTLLQILWEEEASFKERVTLPTNASAESPEALSTL